MREKTKQLFPVADSEAFGAMIRAIREERQWSRVSLMLATNAKIKALYPDSEAIPESWFTRVELGKIGTTDVRRLEALAAAVERPLATMLGGPEEALLLAIAQFSMGQPPQNQFSAKALELLRPIAKAFLAGKEVSVTSASTGLPIEL